MTTNTFNSNPAIKFPNSPSIDISLGLKHCNQNPALYFKILNNFVKRYGTIDLNEIHPDELARTLHSLKGLSLTLGMETLAEILSELETSFNSTKINSFTQELNSITYSIINI